MNEGECLRTVLGLVIYVDYNMTEWILVGTDINF